MRANKYSINPVFIFLHSTNIYKFVVIKTHENNHYSYSSDNINIPEIATKLRKIMVAN